MKKVAVVILLATFAVCAIASTCVSVGEAADASSSITCAVSKWQIYVGESITATGAINPPHAGVGVTLKYTRPVGTTFNRTVTSIGDGSYTDAMVPDPSGMWTVQASWSGDSDTPGNASSTMKFLVSTISNVTLNTGQNQTFSSYFQPAIDEYYSPSLESIVWQSDVASPGGINLTAVGVRFFYDDLFGLGGTITSYNVTYDAKALQGTPEGIYNATVYYDIYSKSRLWPYSSTFLFRYELRCRVTVTSEVIPEFPSFLVLPMFLTATLMAVAVYGRKGAQGDVPSKPKAQGN